MSELTPVPTVEQINLEHRLANSKASEAIQHATHCGLMLLQVKASLAHGEWLPWLNGEIESGSLTLAASPWPSGAGGTPSSCRHPNRTAWLNAL